MNNLKKKVLFGLAIGLALAMAIGSFALEEDPALANAVGTAVSAPQAGTHNITTNIIGSGTVNAPQTASEGDTVSYTPSSGDGFMFSSTSVATTDGTPVTLTGNYTFTMPDADVIISAVFEAIPTKYNISIDSTEHGSITSDVTEAIVGDTVTLTATPDDGYQLQEGSLTVKAGDTDVAVNKTEDGKYTFTMPGADVEVSAVFELIPTPTPPTPTPPTPTPSVIVPVQPDNGNIEVLTQDPEPGDTVIFMVTPNEGYQVKGLPTVQVLRQSFIARLFGNNIGIDVQSLGDNKYSFVMPNDNVAISAEFEQIPTPTPPGPEPGPEPTPTPDPSVDPGQDGDGGSSAKTSDPFMGGVALALLGVATTGAVLVRKRK